MQLSTGARDNRLSALSSFHLSLCPSSPLFPLSPSMHLFYCLPQFPSCNNRYFSFSPYFFFLYISSLLLFHWFLPCFWPVSPFSLCLISSVLSNGSLGSFPHTVSLFPSLTLSIQTLCLFSLLNCSLPYRYNGRRQYFYESISSPPYFFSSL